MFLAYIVVLPFVMALLLVVPLFPFWKVWKRLQTHHPDIWNAAGPFHVADMIRSPGLVDIFITVLMKMNRDTALKDKDPEISRWTAATIELLRFLPKGKTARILMGGIFLVFVHKLTVALVY